MGFRTSKPERLTPFSQYESPSDLAICPDGELYWKGKRLRRSNINWMFVITLIGVVGGVLTCVVLGLSNYDRIVNNLEQMGFIEGPTVPGESIDKEAQTSEH